MEISLIYVLIVAEVMLILIGLSITLTVVLLRKPKIENTATEESPLTEEEKNIDLGNSYIDFLEQAIERNSKKTEQQENIEAETAEDAKDDAEADKDDEAEETDAEEAGDTDSDDNDTSGTTSPAPDEAQSKLLAAREQFLQLEKTAAEKTEHEIHFWDSIYDGMKSLLEQFSTTQTITESAASPSETDAPEQKAAESKEKVFYIETQGKKIDGEVNKLKDIIYEQENALSSMKKAMEGAESENPDDSELMKVLKEQTEAIERQLSDSKMCMEVLEMENNRLQEEVDKIEARHDSLFTDESDNNTEASPTIDIDQMKEVVEQQESRIKQLIDSIESLEIEASQAEKLKETIGDFARTSQEMMSCITILEEENERLVASHEDEDSNTEDNSSAGSGADTDNLKSEISSLEEELIKKDVAYAQLQDEFSSMETEYLAMYEAMHGDNS